MQRCSLNQNLRSNLDCWDITKTTRKSSFFKYVNKQNKQTKNPNKAYEIPKKPKNPQPIKTNKQTTKNINRLLSRRGDSVTNSTEKQFVLTLSSVLPLPALYSHSPGGKQDLCEWTVASVSKKGNRMLGCIKGITSRNGVTISLLALIRPNLKTVFSFSPWQQKRYGLPGDHLEKEHKYYNFLGNMPCEERLEELTSFSLEKGKLRGDFIIHLCSILEEWL